MHAKVEHHRISISLAYPFFVIIFALSYYICLRLGLSFAFANKIITLFNIAAGFGLAILLSFGIRYWPAIFIGAAIGFYQTTLALNLALMLAAAQVIQAILGTLLLSKYFVLNKSLDRIQDVLTFIIIGAVLVTIIFPSLMIISMLAADLINVSDIKFIWINAWLGEMFGVMVFGSVFLAWSYRSRWIDNWLRYLEAGLLFSLLIALGGIVFFGWLDNNIHGYSHYPLAYVFFPLLAWAAFRLGQKGATFAIAILVCFALWGLKNNLGPFYRDSIYESYVLTWLCINTAAGLAMMLAADITQCIKTRVALVKSDERLALAIQGSQDGVWDWMDINKDKIWWSPRLYQLLGYKQNEIESTHSTLISLLHPNDRNRHLEMLEKHLRGDASYNIDFRLQTKYLGYRWFHAKAQAVQGLDYTSKRMAGSLSDIHERKHIQEEITNLNKKLEERVQQRTKDLSIMNENLKREIKERTKAEMNVMQLQEDLIKLERTSTINEMSTSFAHELHQPLTAIVNYAQASLIDLENKSYNEETIEKYLKEISGLALRSGKIVKRLREFSRKGEKDKKLITVNNIIKGIQPLLEMEAEKREIKFNYDFDKLGTCVRADEILIQQVVTNLVKNAIESMNDINSSDKSINISACVNQDGFVHIKVEDHGIGLKNVDNSRIFDSFYTTKSHGVGIGLSISNSIAEAHGGHIKIYNNKNSVGVTSELVLPSFELNG